MARPRPSSFTSRPSGPATATSFPLAPSPWADEAETGGHQIPKDGGAVAFSDDNAPVVSAEIMRRAMEYCRMFDKAVLSHAEDPELTRGGVMHEGFESMRLGLRGIPGAAEEVIVFRDVTLAELGRRPGARDATVSSACAFQFDPPRQLLPASALTRFCPGLLRPDRRVPALLRQQFQGDAAVALHCRRGGDPGRAAGDCMMDVIASDHSPHAPEKKMRELDQAPSGVIGLETLLPVCIRALIEPNHLTWPLLRSRN